MGQASDNLILFGFDLRQLGRQLALALSQLLFDSSSIFAERFRPPLWVLHQGRWFLHNVGVLVPSEPPTKLDAASGDPFCAISIPADGVLFKRVTLPVSSEIYLAEAVALEVDVSSPFPAEHVLSGYSIVNRAKSTIDVVVAITTLDWEEQAQAEWAQSPALQHVSSPPQVCVVFEDQWLIELSGRPNVARRARYFANLARFARVTLAVLMILVLLVLLPAASSWYRAQQLHEGYALLRERAESIDASIDRLHYQRSVISSIAEDVEGRQNYAFWLDHITERTPDETFFQRMRIEALDVQVMGYSDNAANYLKTLTEEQGYRAVTATSAFVRDSRSGKERFNIEWSLVPED